MEKTGIVKEVHDGYAIVSVSRKSACEGCHANADGGCAACVVFGSKEAVTRAENSIGASVGDRVTVETASKTVLFYAAAVFLFPVVAALIGYFIWNCFDADTSIFGALIGFALSFVTVALTLGKSAEKRFDVKITRIL